jgi:hypothetical protein
MYIFFGLATGIYVYHGYYVSILVPIAILFFSWRNIFTLTSGLFIGILLNIYHRPYSAHGTITYMNNKYVFLEYGGFFTQNGMDIKVGDKISFSHYNRNIKHIYTKSKTKLPIMYNHRVFLMNFLKPNKHYDFWMAIILGDKSSLNPNTMMNFINSGVYHFLVISGFHFSLIYYIIYQMVYAVVQRSKKINYFCTMYLTYDFFPKTIAILCCIYYFFLSFFAISSLRAILMMIIPVYSKRSVLFITMIIMVIYDPMYVFNKGFIMSCLGTYMLLNKQKSHDVTIALTPFTGVLNPIALVNNVIASGLISTIMVCGLIACLFQSNMILNLVNPFIDLAKYIFSITNTSVVLNPSPIMMGIFSLSICMYMITNTRYFIYGGFVIYLFGQLVIFS